MFEIWQRDCRLQKYTKFDVSIFYSFRDTAGFIAAHDGAGWILLTSQTTYYLYLGSLAPRAVT